MKHKQIATLVFTILLLLIPMKANAHSVTRGQCVQYSETHGFVVGTPKAKASALSRCMKKVYEHRFSHCEGGMMAKNACVIRIVFGGFGFEAVSVARCESTLNTRAANGQYLGLFQMGASERGKFGHGETARVQAESAYKYFVVSGKDWSPWECKP